MKKIFTLCLVGLTLLIPVTANAFTENRLKSIQEKHATEINYDQDTQNYYYFENGEIVKNRLIEHLNQKYYANENGVLISDWKQINGKWYYFDKQTKVMLCNTYIGQYRLGSDGVWIG